MNRRQFSKSGIRTALIAICVFSLPSAPANAESPDDVLIVAVPQSPGALEPVLRNNTSTLQTVFSVYDRLLTVDFRTGEIAPGLAESWEQIDATTYEFTLRDGVTFHDGGPVTVDDVIFSFSEERTQGPGGEGATVAHQYHGSIESVEAIDERTVRISLNQIDPTILIKLGGWGTEIVSKAAFEAAGGWDGWNNGPVATGPYRIVEHVQDEILVLEAHDDYWRGEPPYDRIEFRVVPESVVRLNGLLAGDFDMITFVSPDQIPQIEEAEGFEVVGGAIQNVRMLSFFLTEGLLADPLIRRAISHAIDRELIVATIWQGRTEVAPSLQHPVFGELFLQDVAAPAYDPDLARTLLEEAGYDGSEIVYRTQTAAYPLELQTSQIILEMLRAVGLNVRLEVVENWAQVEAEPTASTLVNNSTLIAWPDPTGGLLRRYGAGMFHDRDPWTWRNDEFNALAAEFRTAAELDRRLEIHGRLLEIWEKEDPAATVLFYNALFYGKRTDIDWAPLPTLYAAYGPFEQATN